MVVLPEPLVPTAAITKTMQLRSCWKSVELALINNALALYPTAYYAVRLQLEVGAKQMPKLVAVVGGKHSGKTTVIQSVIRQLKSRGYRVGTVKEMVRIPTLDTPATETDRFTEAGAEIVVAVPRNETVIFIKKRLSIKEVLPYLCGLDYVLLEGFESEKTLPKIIAAKTAQEAASFSDGLSRSHFWPHYGVERGDSESVRTAYSVAEQRKSGGKTRRHR